MGLAGHRKPILPAPTESLVSGTGGVEESELVEEEEEVADTDLSQRSDRTHYSIPEDGRPITISTKKTKKINRITKSTQNSQTSLLIEYFEGGKEDDPNRRPSVRVKVVPSLKNKQVSHDPSTAKSGEIPTTSRRIPLTAGAINALDSDVSALDSVHQEDHLIRRQVVDRTTMSASPEPRFIVAPSDISSMPAESMLGVQSTLFAPPSRPLAESNLSSLPAEESVLSNSEIMESHTLKPPVIPRGRNISNERLTQKVIEKLSNKPRPETTKLHYAQNSKGSSRSTGRSLAEPSYERTDLKAKQCRDTDSTLTDMTGPSVLSDSVLSGSARSVATNNSINNPKLLQTVEDAIRRLILPELKELKKDQRQHSRSKYDKEYSDISENSLLREKSARRSTSGEKTRRRRSSKGHSERSGSRRRRSSVREVDYDSMSDSSSRRDASISSISADDPKRYVKSHRTRDAAAAGLVGAGVAAALNAHQSEDSLDRRRRRKRSKSRSSHSASIAESDEFEKHKVPPMPMQSDINSELTRSSILSSNTEMSDELQHNVRQVTRGTTRNLAEATSTTPPHQDVRNVLGMHHGNFSEHNLSSQKLAYEIRDDDVTLSPENDRYQSFSAEDLLEDPERMRLYERNLHTQHPIRRGLSPIQSVASYQTTNANRESTARRSYDSIASTKQRQQQLKEEVSISSFQSGTPDHRSRPKGMNLENRSEIMQQHDDDIHRSPEYQSIGVHDRFDENYDSQRNSFATDRSVDDKRFSMAESYATDKSIDDKRFSMASDDPFDKLTAGQNVGLVSGALAEIIPVPFGVESGVASLVEPSVLSMRESEGSRQNSFVHEKNSNRSLTRELPSARMTSPLKDQPFYMPSDQSLRKGVLAHRLDLSPPQSPARSHDEQEIVQTSKHTSYSSSKTDPLKGSIESDIITNPSFIQGPNAVPVVNHQEPWLGTATPPMPSQGGMSRDFSLGGTDLIPEGLTISQRQTYESKPNTYVIGSGPVGPAALKDEGYATGEGDNYSPAPLTKSVPAGLASYDFDDDINDVLDDPFTAKRNQYVSGLSQGLSPMYEGATGKGLDRIQNNDIIALMQHLTVRDAQRNARDTQILVTLVQSATDMRNSFEEMKDFIAEQDAMILKNSDKQHAETKQVMSVPRSMPAVRPSTGSRTVSQEDLPKQRRNVFKRALQGLGSKNTAELQNIESMLMQLLDEVEALRSHQVQAPFQPRSQSNASENISPPTDTGYEPEGRAGTASSRGDNSALFSNNSSRQGHYSAARRVPGNRVSTVMEGDEDFEDYNVSRQLPDNQHTPKAQQSPGNLQTPNRNHDEEDLTPISYHSSDKKHKTFSSFLPNKFVSRWSKTTASTEPEYRQSKGRPFSGMSRSGTDLHEYEYEHNPDDVLRSATSLPDQENRPPSPLVPSALSDNPKYQAHRNSQNMQHPQPRQGPTGRYQQRLDIAAQTYPNDESMSPISQQSLRWDPRISNQSYHQNLSPISDRERSPSQNSITRRNNGPPRPPKIVESDLNEPLVPRREAKVMSPNYVDDVRAARAGSPAFDKSPIAAMRSPGNSGRKPSGPRPLSASSNKEKRARFVASPVQSEGY